MESVVLNNADPKFLTIVAFSERRVLQITVSVVERTRSHATDKLVVTRILKHVLLMELKQALAVLSTKVAGKLVVQMQPIYVCLVILVVLLHRCVIKRVVGHLRIAQTVCVVQVVKLLLTEFVAILVRGRVWVSVVPGRVRLNLGVFSLDRNVKQLVQLQLARHLPIVLRDINVLMVVASLFLNRREEV